jgi:sentrin-specific protease 1
MLEVRIRSKDAEIDKRLRAPKPWPLSLPPKDEEIVNDFLTKSGVISKYEREQVAHSDIVKLRPGQWLNDEIINFYGALILGRSSDSKENTAKPNGVNGNAGDKGKRKMKEPSHVLDAYYFSTFFWTKMLSEGYQKGRLAKWTKKVCSILTFTTFEPTVAQVDLFSKDVVLIPVNHNNAHWTAAAINFRKKRIEAYDSMSGPPGRIFQVGWRAATVKR